MQFIIFVIKFCKKWLCTIENYLNMWYLESGSTTNTYLKPFHNSSGGNEFNIQSMGMFVSLPNTMHNVHENYNFLFQNRNKRIMAVGEQTLANLMN